MYFNMNCNSKSNIIYWMTILRTTNVKTFKYDFQTGSIFFQTDNYIFICLAYFFYRECLSFKKLATLIILMLTKCRCDFKQKILYPN